MNGFRNFFGNRYGIDNLNITLMVTALALSIISRFFPRSVLLPALGILLIVLVFYRALSTKLVVRRAENEKFLDLWYAVRDWVRHPHFGGGSQGGKRCFKCPNCGQKCRVPRGKGMIAITCPRCGQDFVKKT